VQLADAPLHDMDLLYWSRHFRNMPGQGDLPISKFMNALNSTGYSGYLSLEIFNDHYRSGPRNLIAKDGKRSLTSLIHKKNINQKKENNIDEIEFVEFATEKNDLENLETLFKSLGFTEIGKHKTKSISLFVFDQVKFIINYENHNLVRDESKDGPYPYAYGVKIQDINALFEKAKLLDIDFINKENENNLSMDVIKHIDGLIYIIDKNHHEIWEKDFQFKISDQTNNFNLKIDHIAKTLRSDEMPSALLSYSTLFNFKKSPIVDIIDPHGITKSQIIENDKKTFRMTMNGADNNKTVAGQFLANKKSSGIQHIALKTKNLINLVEMLKTKGQNFLEISNNYYDDIEARFGLNYEFCKKLQEFNILYDEDEYGSFLQIYTHIFNDTFFFEFL
jgi:4-hydroxyphenylpyruvate dioxygenase